MIIFKEHICEVMKKLGLFENFFQNFCPFFVTWGAKSKMCSKNTTFRKKKNFREHRSSQRKILACVSSKHKNKETHARIFVQCQLVRRKFFFFPKFFLVSDQQKPQNPSPQRSTLLSIFSQLIIFRKSSQAFQNHNAISFPKISISYHGNKLGSQNLGSKLKIQEKSI